MLVYLYLFGLIVGGILLGASILLGGKEAGGDHGDAGGEADADHGDGGADKEVAHEGGHGSFDSFLWIFASVRFWTFFLAFFGMTGLALTALDVSTLATLLSAIGMGGGCGLAAVYAIRALTSSSSSSAASADEYVGKTVKVRVSIPEGKQGKVRLQLRGSTVDVLAVTDEAGGLQTGEEALIIEMDGNTARVARVNDADPARRSSS